MSSKIFEDKQNNDLKYIGQKPVWTKLDPSLSKDAAWGLINHQVEVPMSVRNIPSKE